MLRTRTAILSAAAACVQRDGVRKLTMGDVATMGGVAKATLYNHFRTKGDLLAALVEGRVTTLGQSCAGVTSTFCAGVTMTVFAGVMMIVLAGVTRTVFAGVTTTTLPFTSLVTAGMVL